LAMGSIEAKFKLPEITPPTTGIALEIPFATVLFVTFTPTSFSICFTMGYQSVLVSAF